MLFEQPWAQKRMFRAFEKAIFQFFASFWVTKLKLFSGKVMQSVPDYLNWTFVIASLWENRFDQPGAQKRMLWVVEKSIFQLFAIFWVPKLKASSGKVTQSVQDYLIQTFVIGSFLGKNFRATFSSKLNVQSVWKSHFPVFASFWVTKLKLNVGKVRQSIPDYLNQTLVIASFLENSFGATVSSKTNVLSIWKGYFSDFCKFLSDKFETIFWKSEANRSKLFKSKFGHRNLLRKWFWRNLELKNEYSERMKKRFASFLQIFQWRSRNPFLGKGSKVLKFI